MKVIQPLIHTFTLSSLLIWASCSEVPNRGTEYAEDAGVEEFVQSLVSTGSFAEACQELSLACKKDGKACSAYQFFCKANNEWGSGFNLFCSNSDIIKCKYKASCRRSGEKCDAYHQCQSALDTLKKMCESHSPELTPDPSLPGESTPMPTPAPAPTQPKEPSPTTEPAPTQPKESPSPENPSPTTEPKPTPQPEPTPPPEPTPSPNPNTSQPMCAWNQAYEEYGRMDSVSDILANARNCYVLIDPFDSTEARNKISQMKNNGNIVSCYISSGSCENWRDDYSALKPFCGAAYPGWDGEYFVSDTKGILPLMKARIDKMASWGCNFVEFDNMDWALGGGKSGVTSAEARAYNQALCVHARSKGMKCMAKSTTEGAEDFDGLTVESYTDDKNWWSTSEMKNILAQGKIGLIVHYRDSNCDGVYNSYKNTYGNKLSFICSNNSGYLHYNQK